MPVLDLGWLTWVSIRILWCQARCLRAWEMQKKDNRVNSLLSLVVGVWKFLRWLTQWETGCRSPCSANTSWHQCAEPGLARPDSLAELACQPCSPQHDDFPFQQAVWPLGVCCSSPAGQAGIATGGLWEGYCCLRMGDMGCGARKGIALGKGKRGGYKAEEGQHKRVGLASCSTVWTWL